MSLFLLEDKQNVSLGVLFGVNYTYILSEFFVYLYNLIDRFTSYSSMLH